MPQFIPARPVAASAGVRAASGPADSPPPGPPHPLQDLGFFGLDHLEPAVVAALADTQPMLLIGQPGCAKSELLNRIAAALGLRHRHYNASMVSFDDLFGYPVPAADRSGLVQLRMPDDIWDAQAVFFDEISRCRPELQNKFFSVIHERKVNGRPLGDLVYRWSAMNPPPGPDDDPGDAVCGGSLPLDYALADRFAWVLSLPSFDDLDHGTRLRILAAPQGAPIDGRGLQRLLEDTRLHHAALAATVIAKAQSWVNALTAPMHAAGWSLSGRRAVMLVRCAGWMVASHRALGLDANLQECLWATLRFCVPYPAAGKAVDHARLHAVHRAAWRDVELPPSPLARQIRDTADPVQRVALALRAGPQALDKVATSELVTDALAAQTVPNRYILARNIVASLRDDHLTAAAYEVLFEPLGKLQGFVAQADHHLDLPRHQSRQLDAVHACCTRLARRGQPREVELANILYTLVAVERAVFDPEELLAIDAKWQALFEQALEVT